MYNNSNNRWNVYGEITDHTDSADSALSRVSCVQGLYLLYKKRPVLIRIIIYYNIYVNKYRLKPIIHTLWLCENINGIFIKK